MKHIIKLAARMVLAMGMLVIIGCGGPDPDEIAEECIDCLKDADFNGMRKLAHGSMFQWLSQADVKYRDVASVLGEKMAEKLKDTYDELKYEVGKTNIDKDKATVQVKINGQDTPMVLVRINGEWRVETFMFPIL